MVSEPTLGEGGSMRAGSGTGTRGPVQEETSGYLLGWQPPKERKSRTSSKVA